MASNTQTTRNRRRIRKKNAGKENKRIRRNKGTTQAFQIHTAEANANAPAEAKHTD